VSEDANALPESWGTLSLGELGDWVGGGTPSKSNPAFWRDGSIPWVSPKDMKSEEVWDAEDWITEEAIGLSSTRLVPVGSVLVVTRSGILRRTLPVATTGRVVALNQDLKALIPTSAVSPRYIAGALRALEHQVLTSCTKDGTTVQSVELPALMRFRIPLAPAEEQLRIVDAVDELLSDLHAGIASFTNARAKLASYRASVLNAAVSGALTAAWRAEHRDVEPASALLDDMLAERRRHWEEEQLAAYQKKGQAPPRNWREKYQEPIAPDDALSDSWPSEWVVASTEAITTRVTSGSRDWKEFYGRGTGTFVMAQNIRMGQYDGSFRQLVDAPADDASTSRSRVQRDDLLVTIVGAGTGDACRFLGESGEHYVCQSVALMRPVESRHSRFLELYFASPAGAQRYFQRYTYGAGRPHLSFDQLKMTPVALPPLEEQQAIVALVDEQLSEIDHLEAEIDAKLASAKALRRSILHHAFTGRLVPQDPNDEPASELLKRIAAERESRAAVRKVMKKSAKRTTRKSTMKKAKATAGAKKSAKTKSLKAKR
jgi:type I restriction enzyme, S subunit